MSARISAKQLNALGFKFKRGNWTRTGGGYLVHRRSEYEYAAPSRASGIAFPVQWLSDDGSKFFRSSAALIAWAKSLPAARRTPRVKQTDDDKYRVSYVDESGEATESAWGKLRDVERQVRAAARAQANDTGSAVEYIITDLDGNEAARDVVEPRRGGKRRKSTTGASLIKAAAALKRAMKR